MLKGNGDLYLLTASCPYTAALVARMVMILPAMLGLSLIPGSGRSPREGNSDLLQYSCLENSEDRRAWRATVHRVTKSQTQLKQLSTDTRDREQTTLLPEFCVELESFVPTGPLVRVYLLGVSRQIGVSSFGS